MASAAAIGLLARWRWPPARRGYRLPNSDDMYSDQLKSTGKVSIVWWPKTTGKPNYWNPCAPNVPPRQKRFWVFTSTPASKH
eukprot:scaffold21315_cov48-Attheya_sp.AAC.4